MNWTLQWSEWTPKMCLEQAQQLLEQMPHAMNGTLKWSEWRMDSKDVSGTGVAAIRTDAHLMDGTLKGSVWTPKMFLEQTQQQVEQTPHLMYRTRQWSELTLNMFLE